MDPAVLVQDRSTYFLLSRCCFSVGFDPVVLLQYQYVYQWRRSQVKSGGINIEKIEGVGSGEGL